MQSPAFPVGSSPSVAHLSQLETDVGPPRAAAAHLPAGGRPRCGRLAPLLPHALSRLQGPSRDSPSCWTSASPQALLGAQFLGLPLVSMTLAVLRRTAQGWAGWASVAVVRRSAHDEMGGRALGRGGAISVPSHQGRLAAASPVDGVVAWSQRGRPDLPHCELASLSHLSLGEQVTRSAARAPGGGGDSCAPMFSYHLFFHYSFLFFFFDA